MKTKGRLKKFLKENARNSLGVALDLVGENTNIPILSNVIEGIGEKLQNDKYLTDEQKKEAKEIIKLELEELDLILKDVQNARSREIEIAKTGKKDIMMFIAGVVGLSVFVFMVVAIVFIPELQNNKLLIHLLGMVEGIALTIFAYYFGNSKPSKK